METISSMNGKEVLKELKNYEPYKNQTDYYVKKSIGGKKLATVDELKNELTNLQQSTKSYKLKSVKSNENIFDIQQTLPDDILVQTLLQSDINTIINVCTSSKNKEKLCDIQFWHSKFNNDYLPIIEDSKNFNDWVKQYDTIMHAQMEARMMTQIILLYNKYKGDAIIRIWYDKGRFIDDKVKKHVILEKYMLKQKVALDLIYDRKTKDWTIGINGEEETKIITPQNVIDILTIEIYHKINGSLIDFADFNENELYYPNLVKKAKQNKPIPRAYLALYELLMSCEKNN